MPAAARLGDKAQVDADAHGCPACPHPAVGPIVTGSPDVFVNSKPAARQDDLGIHAVCCGPNTFTIQRGSPTVYVNGKPFARMNDQTKHCGASGPIIEGSPDVNIDGELFGRCEVSFHDPSLALIEGTQFQSGTAVQIDLGFGSQLSRIFDGEVVCLEPHFRRDVPPSLHVICYERLHRLALSPATRAFNNVDDDEIVKNIARDHGLTGEAPTGSKSHILQSNVTDAVLLRRLAQKEGNRVRLDGKK